MVSLRAKLVDEFQEQVPNSLTFNVGYFRGQSCTKISLVSNDDLAAMYACCKKDITFWCDSRVEASHDEGRPGKWRRDEKVSKRQDEVEETYEDLKRRHHNTYSSPQLRLWARMIVSHLHSDRDSPLNIPAFSKNTSGPKRSQQSFSDAITGAAVAFAQALRNDNQCTSQPATPTPVCTTAGTLSAAKVVDLRMKNFEQLRYLQQLFDNGILTQAEYTEQKNNILCALRNL